MKSLKKLALALCFFQLISPIFSQENATVPPAQTVYFNEFVQKVYNTLPDIQLNKLKKIAGEVNYIQSDKYRQWLWSARFGGFSESEFTGNLDSPFVFQQGLELQTSIQKTFAQIGGRMNLDFTYRQFEASGIVDGVEQTGKFFVPIVTLQYAQPILKNFLGILDRLPTLLSGLDNKIQDWTVEEENAYLLANYKKIYMQWLVYAQIKDFLQESLDNALQLEKTSAAQSRTGYIDSVDYQNSRILVLDIKNELMTVESAYTNLGQQVALVMQQTNIQPDLQEWSLMQQSIASESFDGIPFEKTRQFLILGFLADKLRHSSFALQNSRLPELNLLLEVATEVYTTNFTPIRNEMIIIPTYYAGLQFKYAFGDTQVRASALELSKSRAEYFYLTQKYQNEFAYKNSYAQRNLLFYRDKLQNREDLQTALNDRYNSQQQRYNQGRDTIASLIDTKNRQLKNKIDEADLQMRLIYEFFDYQVLNNRDEISYGLQESESE